MIFQGLWKRGKIYKTIWKVSVTLGIVIASHSFKSLDNNTHATFFGIKVYDLRCLHVITTASFSVLKFLNHYLLRKLKKKISPFDKRNKHLFRKRYVLPNKANVMVVTNKLMQGFGTSGSINDYRTKFLSGHFGNLFETFSLVIQIILSLLLVIFA